MATSGSYDFSMTRDDLIKAALRTLGVIKAGTNPPSVIVTDCAEALNVMLKGWAAQNIGLWLFKQVTVFPQYETESFSLGASAGHATESYVRTTLDGDVDLGATTIIVDSATGITSAYNIAVQLDDGTLQWTTVSGAPSGTTVTLAVALTDDANDGDTVYCYQAKTQRPLEVCRVTLEDTSEGTETPIRIISRDEYFNIADKDNSGSPNMIYYDPQLTNGTLYVWPTNDDVDNVINLTIKKPIQDFDAATDDCDFPVEWIEAVKYNLALRLAPEYMDEIVEDRMKYIIKMAQESLNTVRRFDSEHNTSIYMVPDIRNY